MGYNSKARLRPTRKCDRRDQLYNIATASLFNAINRESKELLPRSIFIITRRYKRVKIQRCNRSRRLIGNFVLAT